MRCEHGEWTEPPKCVEQTENCGPPPNITNGVIVGEVLASYTPGSSVEYRCNEHHRLNGSKMSYCEKRAWSSPPVCMEPCIPNEDDMTKNHIEIKFKNEGKVFHGDLIEFMCKEGYDLPPSELSVKCHRGELKYPSCLRKERRNGCPPPPIPVNSKIESHSTFHDHDEEVVHIECERHFELRGSHEMRCEHGEWTEPPKCVEQIENCGPPPNITNGVIVGGVLASYTPGSSVEYRCNEHYRLNGSAMSYCEKRAWSSPPVCMEPCTLSEDDMTKNNIEVKYKNEGKVLHGDLIEFRCKEGYELSPSTHSSELSVKCHRGELKYPSCIRKERRNGCPPPPIPVNSKIESHSTFHDHDEEVVHIECERHFELRGSHEMRCEHGEWTEPPKCVEERRGTCEHPPSIENGAPIQNYRAYSCGDKVEYHCERGYHLIGPKEISCHHGQWSSPPECVEHSKHCGPPPSITNGTVVGGVLESYKHGDSVEYRCNEYYLLSGTKTSHCRKGEWSSPPVCMEPCTMNEDDMTKNNIEIKWKHEGKILHGDLIEFKCKQGYELSPSTLLSELSVQCRGGQVKYPSCNRKESKGRCAPPPLIKNGVIISSTVTTYETGSSVEYRCFEHHFLHGHKEAHCVEGIWTPPPVCLEPCTLSHHEMEKNNLHLKWHFDDRPFILHGEYVEFHCKRDTFLVESSVIRDEVRVKCDKGYLKYPRCVERESKYSQAKNTHTDKVITSQRKMYTFFRLMQFKNITSYDLELEFGFLAAGGSLSQAHRVWI
ncbi:PREDICTED: coagulation factor XIII B chain-like [Dipodomys ordii]|uniref:Coagulation factor XIII B chain-like n=1 Tax=Dipodomys ordii TaxID=10020 RepID=A0A1S3F7W2_DIPOR|nr:PREDICTED: coagulation factor XIII B chain-like [Dipodomys ordii]